MLQWPLGWLSDRVSRTLVIAGAALASAAVAIGVALAAEAPLPVLLAAGALLSFGIPIYSLCLAVANDDLPAGRLLGTLADFSYSTGSEPPPGRSSEAW